MTSSIFSRIGIITIIFIFFNINAIAGDDCPPVQKFKELYSSDEDFRKTVDEMFANVQDMPDGTANPWKNKSLNDFYSFIHDWYYFLPTIDDGLDKIIEFSMLYYRNPHGLKFVREEPGLSWTKFFVEERGKYMDSEASAAGINWWLNSPMVNNSDFVLPKEGFSTFNEFFTRDLKPGARKIDQINDNSVLVSPADGVVNVINNELKADSRIPLKGNMTLNISELLDNSVYASNFVGGTAVAVFLMPDNYHHYHAPVSGLLVESNEDVGDHLFGIPDIPDLVNGGNPGYNKDFSVLENFRHGYFIFNTEEYGYVAMVPVGLQTIGSVVFEEPFKRVVKGEELKVYKGEKLGHFAYGGSTVLLLFEKNRFKAVKVNQGQQIGKLNK